MKRTLSHLTYAQHQAGDGGPSVLTLHPYNQFTDSMRETGVAVNPDGRVVAIQSSKGVYIGRTIVGYTWYLGPLLRPSPVHYGDSLAELERFLLDEVERATSESSGFPFLVGDEQGAIMALSMAAVVPELLSGVVAINAALPLVPGWEPPLAPLDGLPILLVNPLPASPDEPRLLTGSALAEKLEEWGGRVTVESGDNGEVPTGQIAEWIARQPIRAMEPAEGE